LTLQETLNQFGKEDEPFFFCISYDMETWDVQKLSHLDQDILFSFDETEINKKSQLGVKEFINLDSYIKKFNTVIDNIKAGNTYLLNLTAPTKIFSSKTLLEIYKQASAKYKIYYKDKFVSFSPETFVTINNDTISTFPMKGTIDATIPNAKNNILNNPKELAEHIMVVDLLRNDLNIVSKNVHVEKFRYIEKIDAGDKELFQVSSKITGSLENNWHEHIGDILVPILPAGSITGTPKKKTVELIESIEQYDRGFFTGIWGIYKEKTLMSSIMIRFIENIDGKYLYKSGGGITLDSIVETEYQEMQDKVYLP
jgi:para-aminobenzoate synthetase component I